MIIVLKPGVSRSDAEEILAQVEALGLRPLYLPGSERTVLGALGDERVLAELDLEGHPLVESVKPILAPWKLVSREVVPQGHTVTVGEVVIGGPRLAVIAGPCAVESREQALETCRAVRDAGARVLRGGAFKPRASPWSFQGLGAEGLRILAEVKAELGLPVVTEVLDAADVAAVGEVADLVQVGARNMQNYRLLQAVGRLGKPVLLKRGLAATLDELLLAAEYVVSEGNHQVVLCERGIRTFESATRNTLDLSAVPWLKQRSYLPVVVDPSHGTGARELVPPMALAAAAAGADGVMIEVHRDPGAALSDGRQSLDPAAFAQLMSRLARVCAALDREL